MSGIERAFKLAQQRYADIGVNVENAMERLAAVKISLHCWQGDDVGGFESTAGLTGGGILATGNYPGKARSPEELRQDALQAFNMIPGKHRFSLHAIYLENGGKKVDRDEIAPEHFRGWTDWAKENELGLDFNPTFFSHPKAADGLTLSHPDKNIRQFWIEHGKASRRIAESLGKELGMLSLNNLWIPDGYKDVPADRYTPRARLKESLHEIYAEKRDRNCMVDSVESKFFGIGLESYTVGSHEFYLDFAARNDVLCLLDSGH